MATDCMIPVYLSASWKGVPFVVETTEDEFGRNGEVYEYPLSEENGYVDLGRKARKFKVEGYLIGGSQVALSAAMAAAAESPQPGPLVHPMFGSQLVACVTCKISADYHNDVRRTKLVFDFVEANASMAPYIMGAATSKIFAAGGDAVAASIQMGQGDWQPTSRDVEVWQAISVTLARDIATIDEAAFDAQAILMRDQEQETWQPIEWEGTAPEQQWEGFAWERSTFDEAAHPIDLGTATVNRTQWNATDMLRQFNADILKLMINTPSIEALVVTARLALIRDFSLSAMQTTYTNVRDAIRDLDFIMSVYDEEEAISVRRCEDILTSAIREARATAATQILARNIRLPGVAMTNVDGVWPSLVVAHKLYFDGRRHGDVEAYNPTMNPFFMGRTTVAPAA